MKKIIIIGARGMVGRAVMKSLTGHPDFQLQTAGRRPGEDTFHCDLKRPETFPVLQGSDCIINCSDNFKASPQSLMQYCLEQGLTLIECTADPSTIETAIKRFKDSGTVYPGTVVLGAGLFPGLSNILAHDLLSRIPGKQELQLSIFISPFSQAGQSTCRLMAEHFSYKAPVVMNGHRRDLPSLQRGPVIQSKFGTFRGLRMFFPEVIMLPSENMTKLESFLIPMPEVLVPILALTRLINGLLGMKSLNTFVLQILRSSILKNRTSHIRIHGLARDATGLSREFLMETRDGFHGIASAVHVILQRLLSQPLQRGLLMPHDVIPTWQDISQHYERLAPDDVIRFC